MKKQAEKMRKEKGENSGTCVLNNVEEATQKKMKDDR